MSLCARLRKTIPLTSILLSALLVSTAACAQSSGISGGIGTGRGLSGSQIGGSASVIGDGLGGFTMYSRGGGISRYQSNSAVPQVVHPDGSRSNVLSGSSGPVIVGPQGTHMSIPGSAPRQP